MRFEDVHVEYHHGLGGLRGVSLAFQRGEFAFLVGPTGAGKSTLLKLLTREVRPTKGEVWLRDLDVGHLREGGVAKLRRQMGIVPQDNALLPRKKVWENVAYAMRAVGHTRREVRQRVPEILEQVGIAARADAYPGQLSGGEQQRVAIARALIANPPLLLADEPTGHLDPETSWEIMELLKKLNGRGTTVLVASHDINVVQRMGKRTVVLANGKVVEDGIV
ncbi:ATP-binding cassette domain-containing protein [bacterium]|nr:MAG: ATP-binding cassette domain-containing protein [bacterium]